ncbi:hypothetical protein FS837_005633 [Tulasnella sp. UAMH 9824]|nr:hypothetical protein FS837_005633 [Tulasnella sp. UAMH 9824]
MQAVAQLGGQSMPVPTLPSFNPRYDRTPASRQAFSRSIPPRAFLVDDLPGVGQSANILNGFKELIHPEGDLYWFDQSRRLVTTSNPGGSPWSQALDIAYQQVMRLLGETTRLSLSSEICLIPLQNGSSEVGYYIIDHDKRVIYWLEEVDVCHLGLGPFESGIDLREALKSEYWVHVDYFPSHLGPDAGAEDDLMAILRHGCIGA